MTDTLDVPQNASFVKTSQGPIGRRVSERRQSYTSWISSLASPHMPGTQITSPPPLPAVLDVHSPASTVRTIKLSHVPMQKPEAPSSDESAPSSEKWLTAEMKESAPMTPVEEVSENATTPTNPLRGKARSIVGGFVSGLRSIPRAVTHSQVYDRRSLGRESSRASHTLSHSHSHSLSHSHAHPAHFSGGGELGYNLKYPGQPLPFTLPILLAPPFAHPPHIGSPLSMRSSAVPGSKAWSEAYTEQTDQRAAKKLGSLIDDFNKLPWVSPRVSVDYEPGVGGRGVVEKTSSSWYSLDPPETPSVISQRWRKLPDPWFEPTHLAPPAEGAAGEHEEQTGADEEVKVEDLKEELQEKAQTLENLHQVVEHQKMHISALEEQIEELRQVNEERLQRRRSSMRQSVRTSGSVRLSRLSTRRASVRVSRTSSILE